MSRNESLYTLEQYEHAKESIVEDFLQKNIKRADSCRVLENLKLNLSIIYEYLDSINIDKKLGLFQDSEVLKSTFNKVVAIRRTFLTEKDERIINSNRGFFFNITTEAQLCVSIEELIKSLGRLVSLNF